MQQQLRKNAGGTSTIFVTSKEAVGWRQDHRVYDIQELFRWLIDLSVIQLLKEKKSKKSDFIVTENYHIRLKEPTAKSLIEKIKLNINLNATFKGRNATYQTILMETYRRRLRYAYHEVTDSA